MELDDVRSGRGIVEMALEYGEITTLLPSRQSSASCCPSRQIPVTTARFRNDDQSASCTSTGMKFLWVLKHTDRDRDRVLASSQHIGVWPSREYLNALVERTGAIADSIPSKTWAGEILGARYVAHCRLARPYLLGPLVARLIASFESSLS